MVDYYLRKDPETKALLDSGQGITGGKISTQMAARLGPLSNTPTGIQTFCC